jgi:NADH-quinone oxidoreductase subunit M
VVPIYAAFFLIFTLASIGLPGMNGFVGEFLIILGGFAAKKWAGVLAATGIIIGAGYMLWLYQRMFFMEVNPAIEGLTDINMRELATLLPMVVLIFWIGVYPNSFLSFMHVSVQHLIDQVNVGSRPEMSIASLFLFK